MMNNRFTTINLKIKIKIPVEIESLAVFLNPTVFRNLLEQYQRKQLKIILEDNIDAKTFWLGFAKYIENNMYKS